MSIRVRTLGQLRFEAETAEILELLERPIRAALLILLAVDRELNREQVLGLLWPESEPAAARHALNQTLYLLRRDLGPAFFTPDGDRLRATDELDVDVQDFRKAVSEQRWDDALRLYGGEFLVGWYLADGHAFEEWVERQRAGLRRELRLVCRAAIRQRLEANDAVAALVTARRWVELDPLEDEAHHRVIALLAQLGDRRGALEHYERYRGILAEEDLAPLEETVALVGEIRAAGADGTVGPLPTHEFLPPGSPPEAPPTQGSGPASIRQRAPTGFVRRHWLSLSAAGLAALGAVLVLTRATERKAEPPPVRNRVLVAPLANESGDSTLDAVGSLAADWILTALGDAEFLEVVPREATRAPAAQPAPLPRQDTSALAAALDNRAGLLLSGRYYRYGAGLEFHAVLLDTRTRQVLESLDPVRSDTPDPMSAINILAQRVRIALAVHLDARLGGMYTRATRAPTYESFRAYTDGLRYFAHGAWAEAISSMSAATALAPDFVAPLVTEGFARLNAGDPVRADSVARLAYQRRDRLAQYDRLRLDILRAAIAGDLRGQYLAARAAARIQPGGTAEFVQAQAALSLGRPREALSILERWGPQRQAARVWTPYWNAVTSALHVLGQHHQELRMASEGRQHFPAQMPRLWFEARALAALGRVRPLRRLLDESERLPASEGLLPGYLRVQAAEELAAHGYAAAAREVAESAVTRLRDRSERMPDDSRIRWWLARGLLLSGREPQASRIADTAAQDSPGSVDFAGLACALAARAGPPQPARDCALRLAGDGTHGHAVAVLVWRARIAAALGEPETALRLLGQAFADGLAFGPWLHSDPFLTTLRSQPAFQALLRPAG